MAQDEFVEKAEHLARGAGDLTLRQLLQHMTRHHNNVSWEATLMDLQQLAEEILGKREVS